MFYFNFKYFIRLISRNLHVISCSASHIGLWDNIDSDRRLTVY